MEHEKIAPRVARFINPFGNDHDWVNWFEFTLRPEWRENGNEPDEFGATRKDSDITVIANDDASKHIVKTLQAMYEEYCESYLDRPYKEAGKEPMDGDQVGMYSSKYRERGISRPHRDDMLTEDTGKYTIVWYINDDYEGGELGFTDPDLGTEIKPDAGDVFIFPSYFEHYGASVTKGLKYINILKQYF